MAVLVTFSATCLLTACYDGMASSGDRLAANEPAHHLRHHTPPVQSGDPTAHVRDAKGDDPTVMDHSENPSDRDMTRRVRQAVMADGSLSLAAYNVSISTIEGRVTLSGPVASETERLYIQEKANNIAGTANVENRLVVRQ
jgi:osmotically-inducible protein OsmY